MFSWVPGHVGIYGNEWADSVAKKATTRESIDINVPYQSSEIKSIYKTMLKEEWQRQWNTCNTTLHDIQPLISLYMHNWKVSRYLETQFHQLRMGKCFVLNSYLFLIKKHPDGLCPTCKCKEDVDHFLLQCPRYAVQRKILFTMLNNPCHDLKGLLGGKSPSIEAIINYVNKCKSVKDY